MAIRKKRKKWNQTDLDYLKENFSNPSITVKEMICKLDCSRNSIYKYVKKLGLDTFRKNEWTEKEDAYLKESYENKAIPFTEICANLQRHTVKSILHRAFRDLGMKRVRGTVTKEDIDFILNGREMTIKEMAAHLNLSTATINRYLQNNSIRRKYLKPWTNEEVEYLKDNYGKKKVETCVIIARLGRTHNSVRQKAMTLGLMRKRGK